ncbi:sugar phosphate isomerase/epimerase [Pullulanibacillus pueri]|uniref:Sugar phosphate isomerase n=1 Tax=Pullulanibacillus pueri TaxID=1437324 RepID=A0A8J2ZTH2_9BACL|nr:sugar phosphate isomerase/epimerase family protein [Pullulanibacillus pueri]MBM7681841.1 sugar phosphate isomerase/epimerase [Pullulanibacillus pueri]GGH76300.1 sugar phosphate isomerase [Pullulanibacillus pueri]
MKIGLSTYSLVREIRSGKMSVLDVIQWAADNGAEHVEIVPFGFTLVDNPELIDAVRQKAEEVGIELSNYAILSNFTQEDDEEYEKEIARVMKEVDVAHRLGVKLMRHDVAWVPTPPDKEGGMAGLVMYDETVNIERFERELPRMASACQRIADYAASYGITTSVENHLYFVQASDRVQRLIQAVNRPNYKTTLDVGNFMCVEENSVVGVRKNLKYASMIHLKDMYFRTKHNPGEGWFPTSHGNYLRGAIFGNGDIDTWEIMRLIKEFGYEGYASIEFEGIEECKMGARVSMENARRMWEEV